MEQTSNNTENNMTGKSIEEEVKQDQVKQDEEVQQEDGKQEQVKQDEVKQEEVQQEELKQEEVINHIDDVEENQENVKQKAKPTTKAKPTPKPQHDTDTKLSRAGVEELADINNQFYTLLNGIDKLPNLKDKLTKQLLN